MSEPSGHYPFHVSKFLEAFLDETKSIIDAIPSDRWAQMNDQMRDTLLTPEGKFPSPLVKLNQRQIYLQQFRLDFTELLSSYDVLTDFPALARTRWPRHSPLTEGKVILFWRESHLNECYIFQNRLITFISRIERSFRKEDELRPFLDLLQQVRELLKKNFGTFEKIRGFHVHQYRHRHQDAEMARLGLLELLTRAGKMKVLRPLYRDAVDQAKRRSEEKFQTFTANAAADLDALFKILGPILITDNGRLRYPRHLKDT